MTYTQFPTDCTVVVTLISGARFYIKADTVDTDDGIVFAEQVDGRLVAFPEKRIDFLEQM